MKVANDRPAEVVKEDDFSPRSEARATKLLKGTLRIFGNAVVMALRAVIECLSDDSAASRNMDMDRRKSDGPAAWIYGLEWNGVDGTQGESMILTALLIV